MKVLFCPSHYVYDELSDGSEGHMTYSLVDRLAKKFPESLVITGYKNIAGSRDYKIAELLSKEQASDLSLLNSLRFNFLYSRAGNQAFKANDFNIYHHVLPFTIDTTFNLAPLLGKARKTPIVMGPIQPPLRYASDVQDDDINPSNVRDFSGKKGEVNPLHFIFPLLQPVLKVLSRQTLKKADRIIVINQFAKELLIKLGIREHRIKVIPIGINSQKFNPASFTSKANDTFELLVVAYLIKRKGVDLVIRGLKEIVKVKPSVRLRIVGNGPQLDSLKKLIDELELNQYVVFEGVVPYAKLTPYYQRAHIFVTMSRAETWGQACLDAMACGLPVISANNVGSAGIIKDNEFGYLIDQEDYHMFAEKTLLLLSRPDIIEKFAQRGRQEIEKVYDWDKVIIPQYLKIYQEIHQ